MNQLQIFLFFSYVQKCALVTQLMKWLGVCGQRGGENFLKYFFYLCLFQLRYVPHFIGSYILDSAGE